MRKPTLSIIILVYNVEKYIDKCVDSVLNSTFSDLVDNGNLDNSGKLCDDYAKHDSRIVVIHKQNSGVSSARDTGIEQAKGQYITFIDGDDFIESDFIERLYDPIKQDSSVVFSHGGCVNYCKNMSIGGYAQSTV